LFREGDDGGTVFVLLAGQVKLSVSALSGKDVILAVRDPREILGEIAAIDGGPRSATGAALNDVDTLAIRHAAFVDFLARHPAAAVALLETIAAKLREASSRQLEFGTSDALSRVCTILLELADRYGSDGPNGRIVELPVSQQELASLAGLSREAVVKGLAALRSLDMIRTNGRSVVLLDEMALRRRSEAG